MIQKIYLLAVDTLSYQTYGALISRKVKKKKKNR